MEGLSTIAKHWWASHIKILVGSVCVRGLGLCQKFLCMGSILDLPNLNVWKWGLNSLKVLFRSFRVTNFMMHWSRSCLIEGIHGSVAVTKMHLKSFWRLWVNSGEVSYGWLSPWVSQGEYENKDSWGKKKKKTYNAINLAVKSLQENKKKVTRGAITNLLLYTQTIDPGII